MIRTIPRIKAINKSEQSRITKLNSPQKIQKFLDSIPYNSNTIYRCPLRVLKDQKAHCFDGAVFAAAILTQIGYKPLILDLYSRMIVGWQISERQNSSLVTTAIISGLIQRGKNAGIIFHSAQGSQYASKVVRDLLATNGIIQSMSK
ncbi:MAG: DDE-type integrase/transposase/recombinase [Ignavibacteriales bacterium]|nr:DDE-type integrase/transposase/recombinase [Ignavibacteriales bacterium]